ncbi:uncharacterized protein LOC100142231 [Tribolium castaneum]|uniref:ZP domain-containing protein n=1 Tax=Tribolium castaneum TaxID=7070 RepID=D6WG56_TRICA|nr:PREDICTED: uncharacterized protein LOC100142231 [Tribolium castaneum]EFA00531.2 hypothetical protein TcasGA2_TC003396 [Tribolium castaneum]|eukprot:XP_008190797.1 PREDICTED: uncharacterized protein LOC100142231 [Tribolium castaneum]
MQDIERHLQTRITTLFVIFIQIVFTSSQDYEVTEIQCTFASGNSIGPRDSIIAKLRKPDGFKGNPLFADDRGVDPETDHVCQIKPDLSDPTGLKYNLKITDFSRCGVLKRNGFVHVRVWFPQFPGVVMQSDQELIIMCKPPEPTVIENKAAGFAGSFPHGARVSGVVEETPGRLEYEVALYKEAPARISNATNSELPVDQAVPIGTKLQLRARISPESAWKYVKLMEVTVSPDPDDPHMIGSVALVKDGCRNRDFASIIPHQPARYRERHNEVFLDFEAFLLSTMKERSTLWIHSQIKACMDPADCQPDFCLDLFEPSGHGRKRRDVEAIEVVEAPELPSDLAKHNATIQYTKIKENLEYTVLMPGEFYHRTAAMESSCSTFLAVAAILGCLLFLSAFVMCWLASRLHSALVGTVNTNKNIDELVRESRHYSESGYTGRATTQ